jgi:DNA-binding NarL/FixJ family response regulator
MEKTKTCKCAECGAGKVFCKGLCEACYRRARYREQNPVTRHEVVLKRDMEIARMLKRGMTQSEIARKKGVSRQAISKIAKRIERNGL